MLELCSHQGTVPVNEVGACTGVQTHLEKSPTVQRR